MNVRLCVATRNNTTDFAKTPICCSWDKFCDINISVEYSNKNGLSKVYNYFIDEFGQRDDYLIFVHDDVSIEDVFLKEKLSSALNAGFDIVGLAGTSQYEISRDPALWHVSPPNTLSGAVAHIKEKTYWVTSFGKMPKRVLILDGLFLAVSKRAIDMGVRFDERFSFHHYDIDFCLSAHSLGLKMTTSPIWAVHHSVGEWRNDSWKESNEKFLEKWRGIKNA